MDLAPGQIWPTRNFLVAPENAHGGGGHKRVSPACRAAGGRMKPCQGLPLLLLLGLVGATTPGPDGSPSVPPASGSIPPGLWTVPYNDIVLAAVELLNAKAIGPHVLRLRDTAAPNRPLDLQQRQELTFTMEETTCHASGTATTACKSLWLGPLTHCQGWVFLEQQQPTVELSCKKGAALHPRIKTSKLKSFFTKLKERVRNFFQCRNIWIRDKLNLKVPRP